ncbi:MAG: hypothetical protein GXO10_04150 [Crenarchaeota archaeon]|nr:hypothetical protein [Thermoproteota archaeon]
MSLLVISDEPRRLEYLISRRLGAELKKIENSIMSIEEVRELTTNRIVLLRVYSPYKLLTLSLICEKCSKKIINSSQIVLLSFSRELLYRELERHGIETPKRYYIFDICNVNEVIEKIGKTRSLLLTFTKSDIEGLVETPQALVSLVEHRYYMSAEDVKINLVIPNIENIENILVIGNEPEKPSPLVEKIINIFGEGIYSITIARQDGRDVLVSIDPVPMIEDDEKIEKVLNYLREVSKT